MVSKSLTISAAFFGDCLFIAKNIQTVLLVNIRRLCKNCTTMKTFYFPFGCQFVKVTSDSEFGNVKCGCNVAYLAMPEDFI